MSLYFVDFSVYIYVSSYRLSSRTIMYIPVRLYRVSPGKCKSAFTANFSVFITMNTDFQSKPDHLIHLPDVFFQNHISKMVFQNNETAGTMLWYGIYAQESKTCYNCLTLQNHTLDLCSHPFPDLKKISYTKILKELDTTLHNNFYLEENKIYHWM